MHIGDRVLVKRTSHPDGFISDISGELVEISPIRPQPRNLGSFAPFRTEASNLHDKGEAWDYTLI